MKTKLSIAISAALLSSASFANTQMTGNKYDLEILSIDQHKKPAVKLNNITTPQRFIVELSSPAVAAYQGGTANLAATAVSAKDTKLNIQSTAVQNYASHLATEQKAFTNALSSVSANSKVERQFKTLFNGVTVTGQNLTVEQLMAIPGVKSVYPETMYDISMDASLQVINTDAMWETVSGMENAGKGIRVAVIDGGIRPENPMFADEGFEAPMGAMPTDDYCSTTDESFCNNKLIVARWSQPTFEVCADEYMSPLGFGGHGTHVAGTAVGNQVSTQFNDIDVELSGVAPAAYLMSYKALYSTADCTGGSGSNIMLMEALEHAVNDGADVINNSWGGGAGADPASSPYKTMFEAAEAAGVIVVSAAGNDGNDASTIGCPACIESGIAVANSTTGRYFANSFNAGGEDLLAIPGSDTVIEMDVTAPVIAAINVDEMNFEGCEAFPVDSFKGSIALISRGLCAFSTKAENAINAGAEALVVYNSNPGAPITMSMPGVTFPSIMISNDDGTAIIDAMGETATTGTVGSEIKHIMVPALADTINSSSSRGPNGNQNMLKPDLAAPGTNILSAYSPDDGGEDFNMISGTSMASPHVAGAAAMMRQLHPDWSANDIKTALTSTSTTEGILDDDATTAATPFAMGAGRMDLDAAAKAVLTFDKPSIAADSCVGPCTFTRTVYNKSDEDTSWSLAASSDSAGITVSPSMLDIPAGGSATFMVTVDSTFSDYGDWIFGNVMLTSAAGLQNAHLPLAVLAQESSDASLISISSDDSDLTTADDMEITAVLNNTMFENTVTFTAKVPEGTMLTSEDDVSVSLTNATQNGFSVNEDTGVITWVGSLEQSEMSLDASTGTYPSIFALDLAYVPPCDEGCDEKSFDFNTPSFKYNGVTYSSITISDNGIVLVGGGNTSGTWNNKELPDSTNPNNILAPFWSDYDLSDGTEGDTGGGQLGLQFVSSGDDTYIVVEWDKAQLWNDTSGDAYSFSVWIKAGDTQDVSFNYLDIPNLPANVSVGAENIGGTIGTTYHYNGEGSAVTSGDYLQVVSAAAGQVKIDYKATASEFDLGYMDTPTTEEESATTFNVLENDTMPDQKVARAQVTGDGMTATAQRIINTSASGALGMAMIIDEPSNGTVTLTESGEATYTPNTDFFGMDSFTYSSTDTAGTVSTPTEVKVTVTNVNDAPTVSASGMSSTEGFVVTAKASGSDVDGDTLTYNWVQTSGGTVEFSNGNSSISFTAPAGDDTYTFEVTASDGELESEPATATISVTEKETSSSGGSMGWLTTLLLPLAAFRRRKMKS
ncbi:peptidase S8 [Shewanella sp. 10N.286.51.B7]|uniref:S8 family serine peptidase n=1 Tax=Shewanella sp. 10N.286.51.B7 TaxID=1880836 RepID=UPI000C857D37|nr:S8 family serine peptidase [Shewanella sp. 10N.286.51.B7]PMG79362.1 peptidase S8 [Shewanella sp. 10N.286.51.B7]